MARCKKHCTAPGWKCRCDPQPPPGTPTGDGGGGTADIDAFYADFEAVLDAFEAMEDTAAPTRSVEPSQDFLDSLPDVAGMRSEATESSDAAMHEFLDSLPDVAGLQPEGSEAEASAVSPEGTRSEVEPGAYPDDESEPQPKSKKSGVVLGLDLDEPGRKREEFGKLLVDGSETAVKEVHKLAVALRAMLQSVADASQHDPSVVRELLAYTGIDPERVLLREPASLSRSSEERMKLAERLVKEWRAVSMRAYREFGIDLPDVNEIDDLYRAFEASWGQPGDAERFHGASGSAAGVIQSLRTEWMYGPGGPLETVGDKRARQRREQRLDELIYIDVAHEQAAARGQGHFMTHEQARADLASGSATALRQFRSAAERVSEFARAMDQFVRLPDDPRAVYRMTPAELYAQAEALNASSEREFGQPFVDVGPEFRKMAQGQRFDPRAAAEEIREVRRVVREASQDEYDFFMDNSARLAIGRAFSPVLRVATLGLIGIETFGAMTGSRVFTEDMLRRSVDDTRDSGLNTVIDVADVAAVAHGVPRLAVGAVRSGIGVGRAVSGIPDSVRAWSGLGTRRGLAAQRGFVSLSRTARARPAGYPAPPPGGWTRRISKTGRIEELRPSEVNFKVKRWQLADPSTPLATRLRRFFYDDRDFAAAVSPEYWRPRQGAGTKALHHWLFPQTAQRIPRGFRNAGFNLVVIDARFNSWMGGAINSPLSRLSTRVKAYSADVGIKVAIPGGLFGGAYIGAELGWD